MKLPNEIGPIHFVGIGGIGMSGIAEVLINLGHTVQGSDASDNANVKRLRERGATVFVGHDAANLGGAAVVVVSTAIKRDNPELAAARARRIPVVRRAEMLAELMRLKQCVAIAGTHGKTTTTSLVATLLDAAGLDPTVINGGIINAYGTNARLGGGDWMVVEADESDGTFLKLPADVAIVTNIDPEHLDHFKTFDAIKEAFLALIENLPFYGFAVMCLDHPTVQELVGRIEDRRVLTYGENPQADVRLMDVDLGRGVTRFAVLIRERATGRATYIDDLALPMPGRHNALNATAAIAVAHQLGAPVDVIRKAIAGFGGVKRRFTRTGEWNGVAIYDDYGHHPVEIAAVLKAARAATDGKVIAIVQPHRYSRLASLFDAFATCFNDADSVVVADVYPAGEPPIDGVDKSALASAIAAHGHRHALPLSSPDKLAPLVREMAAPGDIVVFLGAGTITQWAYALPGELARLTGER
jgi:UDP-N-acetylmuramate--alanine ligase